MNMYGPAIFFRIYVDRDPVGFCKFATNLYDTGEGLIGEKGINPRSVLMKRSNKKGIEPELRKLVNIDGKFYPHGMTPATHWIVMSALRYKENNFVLYWKADRSILERDTS